MTSVSPKSTINSKQSNTSKNLGKTIFLWIAVVLIVIFCLAPVMWQLLTSFKTKEAIEEVPTVYFTLNLTWKHYIDLFSRRPFWLYILNSAFVSFVSTAVALGVGAPAAYALSRLRPWGGKVILAAILIVTLFPGILLFLGLLEIIQWLHLGNNYLALIIPYTAINLPLTILVLRSFFEQLPKDLEDSARIDGYNTVQMLVQILIPMTIPALVTTGILTFIFAWNEFIFALTFITRDSMKTIPIAAAQLGGASSYEIPYGSIAAATVVGTFPLVLLVLFFQRKIVQGLTAGAVKG